MSAILLTTRTPEGCAVARDKAEERGWRVVVRLARSRGDSLFGISDFRSASNLGSGACGDGTGLGCGSESREAYAWSSQRGERAGWGGGKAAGYGYATGCGAGQGHGRGRGDGCEGAGGC